jgi:predicted outer membrane repeat protein
LTIENIIFDGMRSNYSSNQNRLAYVNPGSVVISDKTTIRNFYTAANGGVILCEGNGIVSVNNTSSSSTIEFINNRSTGDGGVIRVSSKQVNVNNNGTIIVSQCVANYGSFIETTGNGGHISITNNGIITFNNCTSANIGGVICGYTSTSNVTISGTGNTTFTDCRTTGNTNAGCIYSNGAVNIKNCTFTNCSGKIGGAI